LLLLEDAFRGLFRPSELEDDEDVVEGVGCGAALSGSIIIYLFFFLVNYAISMLKQYKNRPNKNPLCKEFSHLTLIEKKPQT